MENIFVRHQRFLGKIHGTLLFAVYSFIGVRSFLFFDRSLDSVAVHLPRALAFYNLTTFQLPSRPQIRNLGFPPLLSYIQGFFVFITGRLSASNLAAFVGFMALVLTMKLLFKKEFSAKWFLTMCLALPLFVLHLGSTMSDLFNNCAIAVAFGGIIKMRQEFSAGQQYGWSAFVVASGVFIGMLTKMQSWPIMGLYTIYATGLIIIQGRKNPLPQKKNWLLLGFIALCFVLYPVRNTLLFGNPTFPIQPPFLPFALPSFREAEARPETYPPLIGKPNIYKFAFSALEINKIVHPSDYQNWKKDIARNALYIRIGGWFFLTTLLIVVFALLCIGFVPKDILILHLVSVLFFASLPGSFYLRYSFFIPLNFFIIFCAYKTILPAWHGFYSRTCFAISAILALTTQLPGYWKIDPSPPSKFATQEIKDFWAQNEPNTDEQFVKGEIGNYYMIFWSGPTFNEYHVTPVDPAPTTWETIQKDLERRRKKK